MIIFMIEIVIENPVLFNIIQVPSRHATPDSFLTQGSLSIMDFLWWLLQGLAQ